MDSARVKVSVTLLVLAFLFTTVTGRPAPQNTDTELIFLPPAAAAAAPATFTGQTEGFIVGEVIVSTDFLAIKRGKKKKKPSRDGAPGSPSFSARVADNSEHLNQAEPTADRREIIFFSSPSVVLPVTA